MRTFFAESRIAQPIKKLDFVILNEFPIFGMENWGLIFLDQSFLLKNEPIEQFNLISHEVVHQWIGNLVTNRNWSQLCIQEGLAEYMTRKLVEDAISKGELLGMSSKRLEFYSTERYLRAMNIETKNSQNGRKAIIQDYRTFDQAGDFCFGKSPLIFLSVEKVLGSKNFKKRLNAFVENFAYKNFDIHDLVGYFDDSESTNIEKFMKYEMIHGAFRIVNVYKNQTFWTLTPSVFDLPIPVQIRYLANQNNESYIIRNTTQISAPHRHKDDLIIVNAAAEHFYRVNYDLATWHRLSIYMKNWSDSLGILSLAKLLNDYCFFYGRFKNDSVLNGILLREMKENMAVILKNFHEASNFVFQNSFNCHAIKQ
uniref:Peptidase M1 membrane alanine aminopeptidase domain-containing protein n=1 Tax=Romanomermis culicivorax TaxID=13658 RepID=A0A915I473_ROMCU